MFVNCSDLFYFLQGLDHVRRGTTGLGLYAPEGYLHGWCDVYQIKCSHPAHAETNERGGDSKVRINGPYRHFWSSKPCFRLMSFPKGLAVLLSHLDVSDVDDLPIDIFSMVDTALVSAYPPPAELLATCIDVLRLIGQIIHSTPVSMLVQLVTTIGKSLRLWIGDEKEVMLESEYNAVVRVCTLFVFVRETYSVSSGPAHWCILSYTWMSAPFGAFSRKTDRNFTLPRDRFRSRAASCYRTIGI